MKYLALKIVVLLFLFTSCKQTSQKIDNKNILPELNSNSNEEESIKFLKEFYLTFYGVDEIKKNRNELLKEYVSSRILKKMDSLSQEGNLVMDYDPFIQGQDYNSESIKKTLEIKPLLDQNEYRVSFSLFGNKDEKLTNIDLLLKKENGKYLIYSILNDDFLSFKAEKGLQKNNKIWEENFITPDDIVNNFIFKKDNEGKLLIDKEILDYIANNTTKQNSDYLKALENYVFNNRNSEFWSIEEFAEIKAYIFNTSYPLRKKFWVDEYKEWYNGKPEEFLGAVSIWRENDYYDLTKLEEYVYDFREKLDV